MLDRDTGMQLCVAPSTKRNCFGYFNLVISSWSLSTIMLLLMRLHVTPEPRSALGYSFREVKIEIDMVDSSCYNPVVTTGWHKDANGKIK